MDRLDLLERARTVFNELDKDKSGALDIDELTDATKLWCDMYNQQLEIDIEQDITIKIAFVDKNGDGKIDLLKIY